jgi:chromosome segregation ATPase
MTNEELLGALGAIIEEKLEPIKGEVTELKEDIIRLRTEIEDYVPLNAHLRLLGDNVKVVKGTVSTIQKDVTGVKADTSSLKSSVASLEKDLTIVKRDVSIIKTELREAWKDIGKTSNRVSLLEEVAVK